MKRAVTTLALAAAVAFAASAASAQTLNSVKSRGMLNCGANGSLGLNFTAINYFDGQGFLVRKALKVNSALELNDAAVCVQQGTTTELNLADYFRANKMKLKTVTFASADEAIKAYDSGRCDAFTTDASGLYAERLP